MLTKKKKKREIYKKTYNQNVNSIIKLPFSLVEMANKPVSVGIARTRPRFDRESSH